MSQDTARRLSDVSNSQGSNSSNSSSGSRGSGKTLSLAEYARKMRSFQSDWAAQARAAGLHLPPSRQESVDDHYSLAELEAGRSLPSRDVNDSPRLTHDQDAETLEPTMNFV
eukprot:COSAG05_NODE_7643_length_785_cov_2.039359_1_plen_111_part_10